MLNTGALEPFPVWGRIVRKFSEATGDGDQESSSSKGQESSKPGDGKKDGDQESTFTADYVRQLRQENAAYRTKLKEREDAEATEITRAKKERDEALAELEGLRKDKLIAMFTAAASREGAKYPDIVALKVPLDTKPENLAAVIKALRKDYADLFNFLDGEGGKQGDTPSEEVSPGLGRLRAAYNKKKKEE